MAVGLSVFGLLIVLQQRPTVAVERECSPTKTLEETIMLRSVDAPVLSAAQAAAMGMTATNRDVTSTFMESSDADSNSYPFSALVAIEATNAIMNLSTKFCTGVFIHPQIVITAANCISNRPNVVAKGGSIADGEFAYTGIARSIVYSNSFSPYSDLGWTHDVAFLLMSKKLPGDHLTLAPIGDIQSWTVAGFTPEDEQNGRSLKKVTGSRGQVTAYAVEDSANPIRRGFEGAPWLYQDSNNARALLIGISGFSLSDATQFSPLIYSDESLRLLAKAEGALPRQKPK